MFPRVLDVRVDFEGLLDEVAHPQFYSVVGKAITPWVANSGPALPNCRGMTAEAYLTTVNYILRIDSCINVGHARAAINTKQTCSRGGVVRYVKSIRESSL